MAMPDKKTGKEEKLFKDLSESLSNYDNSRVLDQLLEDKKIGDALSGEKEFEFAANRIISLHSCSSSVGTTTDFKDSSKIKKVPESVKNLWVRGLSEKTKAVDLKTLFSKCGKVVGAKIVTNSRAPCSHFYGFVMMFSSEQATACVEHLHHAELHGKILSVEKTTCDFGMGVRKKEAQSAKSGEHVKQGTTKPNGMGEALQCTNGTDFRSESSGSRGDISVDKNHKQQSRDQKEEYMECDTDRTDDAVVVEGGRKETCVDRNKTANQKAEAYTEKHRKIRSRSKDMFHSHHYSRDSQQSRRISSRDHWRWRWLELHTSQRGIRSIADRHHGERRMYGSHRLPERRSRRNMNLSREWEKLKLEEIRLENERLELEKEKQRIERQRLEKEKSELEGQICQAVKRSSGLDSDGSEFNLQETTTYGIRGRRFEKRSSRRDFPTENLTFHRNSQPAEMEQSGWKIVKPDPNFKRCIMWNSPPEDGVEQEDLSVGQWQSPMPNWGRPLPEFSQNWVSRPRDPPPVHAQLPFNSSVFGLTNKYGMTNNSTWKQLY